MMPKRLIALDVYALEHARLRKGLLRKEVGQEAGIALSSVSRAFNGGLVGVRVARAIAHVLDLDLEGLWVGPGATRGQQPITARAGEPA